MPPALASVIDWYCPSCGKTDRTPAQVGPHIRYHTCPRLRYLSAPMVRRGTSAKVTIVEREDYVGSELVQVDPERGRPVMSIVTTRDDGSNDVVVFAPTARSSAEATGGRLGIIPAAGPAAAVARGNP